MTTEAQRYAQLHEILGAAMELESQRRDAYVHEACGDDAELLTQVQEMLHEGADESTNDVFAERNVAAARLRLDELVDRSGESWLPERIGSYTILREIGRGGMGIVYEAEQPFPKRRVAIKLLHPIHATDENLKRFHKEASLLGRLQHAGIAQIFEASTYDVGRGPQPYFAMELVEGECIDAYVAAHELDIPSRLEVIARLCDTLHYAHQKGVLHRDLKPANILVTSEALTTTARRRSGHAVVPQPKILDFGVARALDADPVATLQTSEGQLVGTVPYMSPEQASGETNAVDVRSDVYAVGLIAYELLAGQLPYDVRGKRIHEAVRVIREDEPSSLGAVDGRLRGDVETIVAKALEKDRTRRYASAAELAEDIRRYLEDKPIEARPPSALYQLSKFARRNKTLVGGAVATLIVALIGAGVATRFAIAANTRADELERTSYLAGISAAKGAIDQQDYATAAEHLERCPEGQRGWEHDYLRARLEQHTDEWEPAPSLLAAGPVFDSEERRMFALLMDGRRAVWELSTGRLLEVAPARTEHGDLARGALHGPTLRYAISTQEGAVGIGSLDSNELRWLHEGDSEAAKALAWDTAGERLLYYREVTHLWDGESSGVFADLDFGHGAFSHDGERVALARHGIVALFDADSGEQLAEQRVDDGIVALAFAPDDATLAATGHYRNVFLFDAHTLDLEQHLVGHQDAVHSVAWSPDGSRLITSSGDGTARIWDATGSGAFVTCVTKNTTFSRAVPLPGGEDMLVLGERILRFPIEDANVLRGHGSYVYHLGFSPDGAQLVSSAYQEPDVLVWDVASRSLLRRLPTTLTLRNSAPYAAFSEDGQRVVARYERETRSWDVATGAASGVSSIEDPMLQFVETLGRSTTTGPPHFARSPDGATLAACDRDIVELLDWQPAGPPQTSAGGLTMEGKWMLDEIRNCRAAHRGPVRRLEGHLGQVYCVAFSPDGSRIATGGNDATVRIWDAATCEELLVLRGHGQYVHDVEFSPDGSVLASASGDRTVRLWDTK